MKLSETRIPGVMIVESKALQDNRGAFSRLYCYRELHKVIGQKTIAQINHSITHRVGAVRGLHFQNPPYAEIKIVRCLKGRVFDVAVDLRNGSPTYLHWTSIELTPINSLSLVIPEGCAHGFQVLEKDSELLYLHTEYYRPDAEDAVKFDDPRIGVNWPLEPSDISDRDLNHQHIRKSFKGIII